MEALSLWHRIQAASQITYFFPRYTLMAPPRCQYCGKTFQTPRAVNHHISALKSCARERLDNLIRNDNLSASPSPKRLKKNRISELEGGLDENLAAFESHLDIGDEFVIPSAPREASVKERDSGGAGGNTYPANERFIESYHGEAGNGLRQSKTQFEFWLENQREEEKIPWFPFASEQEWALAKWLLKEVGQKSMDEFLKLPIVSQVFEALKKNSL
jgi:hypothetical protein